MTAGGVALLVGAFSRIFTTASTTDQGALAAGSIGLAALVGIAAVALVVVAGAMLQALIVTEIASGTYPLDESDLDGVSPEGTPARPDQAVVD